MTTDGHEQATKDEYGMLVDLPQEIRQLCGMAFYVGQRSSQEPLDTFSALTEQRDRVIALVRLNTTKPASEKQEAG